MKIGITIPNYYSDYLSKIANLNGNSPTKVCSLIVENFLSYNLKMKKFPLFRKDVRIVFANEISKNDIGDSSNLDSSGSDGSNGEQLSSSRDEILASLEVDEVEDQSWPDMIDDLENLNGED